MPFQTSSLERAACLKGRKPRQKIRALTPTPYFPIAYFPIAYLPIAYLPIAYLPIAYLTVELMAACFWVFWIFWHDCSREKFDRRTVPSRRGGLGWDWALDAASLGRGLADWAFSAGVDNEHPAV